MQRRRVSWMSLTALVLLLLAAVAASAQTQSRKLSLDLYLEFEEVADPRISPDGKQIVFTRRWVDKLNDKGESALWVMNADGSKQRFLVKGSSARWSPDGTRIAYLAEGERKGTQIFNEEYHGTSSKPSNFMRTQLYLRYWFEKYTKK